MRHSAWTRALIVFWSIWFATALTEPAGLLACREHSSVAAATPTDSHHGVAQMLASGNAESHHAHASPDAPVAPALHSGDHSPAPADHSCCTCLGQCCTMTPAESTPDAGVLVAAMLHAPRVVAFAQTARLPIRPAHALPFANGPPPMAR